MQIDYALILSAGLGTRMGEIGKVLPKVMWPILNKRLIDLQISYCKKLGIKKIYINVHYQADTIINHIRQNSAYDDITILKEEPLLDSGGAIHNLAVQKEINYKGNVLTVNGDQFLFFDELLIKQGLEALEKCRCVLFGINVDKSEKYNETIINKEGDLVDIIKNNGERDYVTFSGLGIIKLDSLLPIDGPSKFFQTVANFKKEKVRFITPSKIEYWDFGTSAQFFEAIKKMKKLKNEDNFINFLSESGVDFNHWNEFYNQDKNSISLLLENKFEINTLIYKDIKQQI